MKKHKIVKRDKFLDNYIKAYREGAINLGVPASAVDKMTTMLSVYVNDIRRQMRINGMNFIVNEKPPKFPVCIFCAKEMKRGGMTNSQKSEKKGICDKCIAKRLEKIIGENPK